LIPFQLGGTERGERVRIGHGRRRFDLFGAEVGRGDVQHLAVAYEFVEGFERLVLWRLGIREMLVVDIDPVRTQATQARVATVEDPPPQRPRRVRLVRGRGRNFVLSTTSSRRFPSAAPMYSSEVPPPYISAVSRCVTPASSAACRTAELDSKSSRMPKLLHPRPTTDTSGPSLPSRRVSISSSVSASRLCQQSRCPMFPHWREGPG